MNFCALGRMPFQLFLLLAVLAPPGLQSASHRRSNLRLPASASSLIDSVPVKAVGVTTTAVSVWPAEKGRQGLARKLKAKAAVATVAPGTVPPPAAPGAVQMPTMGPVIPPVGAGAPPGAPLPFVKFVPAPPVAYSPPAMIVNASSEPCNQINLTETLKQIQNAAHLSAQAAQATLNKLGQAGGKPSIQATIAYGTAVEAAGIWEGLLHSAARTERTNVAIQDALKIYGKVGLKAANNYHQAVTNVRDFPPHIPAVQVDEHLAGLSRT